MTNISLQDLILTTDLNDQEQVRRHFQLLAEVLAVRPVASLATGWQPPAARVPRKIDDPVYNIPVYRGMFLEFAKQAGFSNVLVQRCSRVLAEQICSYQHGKYSKKAPWTIYLGTLTSHGFSEMWRWGDFGQGSIDVVAKFLDVYGLEIGELAGKNWQPPAKT